MKRRIGALALELIVLLASGCKKTDSNVGASTGKSVNAESDFKPPAGTSSISDNDAIAAAIQKHLESNKGINMAAMDMNVGQVNITGDQAQVDAEFRLKQGGTSMQMTYFLQRHAGGWIVLRSQPAGGQFAHPPMDKIHSGIAADPAHPALPNISEFFKNAPQNAPDSSASGRSAPQPASKAPR